MNKQLLMTIDKEFAVEENSRKIRMIGSTSTADRVGDVMNLDPSCVDLKHYMMNPVILENHDYHRPAIAKCVGVEFKDNQMIFDIEFADTERGNEYLYLYKNGYQSASSIGFIATEYEPAMNEKGERTGGLFFKKWSLLELSLVTVPCNPEAIVSAKEFISEELYKELVIEDDTKGHDNVIDENNMTINKSDMQSILKALEIADRIISKSEEGQAEADDSDDTSNEDDTENDDNADTKSETQKPTEDDTDDSTDEEIEVSEAEIMAEVIKQLLKGE